MKVQIVKYRSELIGVAIGAIAGWCYWYFVGCASGNCAITSNPFNSTLYGAFFGGFMGGIFKKDDKNKKERMKTIEEMIRTGKAVIVDVRTAAEFAAGHVKGSINIPLQEIPARLSEFDKMQGIILCCASGNRSGQAAAYLKQQGIECENGGSWMDVNCYC